MRRSAWKTPCSPTIVPPETISRLAVLIAVVPL
jgi:hypothetical protein